MSGVHVVTTVENEYPFVSYVEESGGPTGLGANDEVAVYTAGFPTPALMAALTALSLRLPEAEFHRWGDADVGGLRIWWMLRSRLGRRVSLFRTTPDWLETEAVRGGNHLSDTEVEALRRMRAQVLAAPAADTQLAGELIDMLLRHGIKIEQERY